MLQIDNGFQARFQCDPLRLINFNLKDRVLHSLAIIPAGPGDTSKTACPASFHGAHIVGHK